MALKVVIYIASALYGFSITFFGMQRLRKVFFQSTQKGRFNPYSSIPYMFVGGILLVIPAFYDIWAFLASFLASMITNFISLISLAKANRPTRSQQKKSAKG